METARLVSDSLLGRRIAILGFGNQGAAHAVLLRASGCDVIVGARTQGAGAERARAQGFAVRALPDALAAADVAAVLLPDEVLPELWETLAPSIRAGQTLVFAHGFNLLYGGAAFPSDCDVVLVSPTAPGWVMARGWERGERVPAYLAVHQDASGTAWDTAAAYAEALKCGPLLRTTVREETEVDLFGEQVVLCGGMNALVLAAWETLVARGYTPEIAYLECVHQLRYLAELLHERGPAGFRGAISGTARYGDLTRGPRVIGAASRAAMQAVLEEIRDGTFAREWRAEMAGGGAHLERLTLGLLEHPVEAARRRALGETQGEVGGPAQGSAPGSAG
jgi:ketol-acid reductoisomerase